MLERSDGALTKAQLAWLKRADKRPIKRRQLQHSGPKKTVYFLARQGFLQFVAGVRNTSGDMWHITDAGRALKETPRHPAAKIAWMKFAKDVRAFRQEQKIGVRQLSRNSGIPSPTISRLERGRPVDAETFTFFADWIGCDPREYLLSRANYCGHFHAPSVAGIPPPGNGGAG